MLNDILKEISLLDKKINKLCEHGCFKSVNTIKFMDKICDLIYEKQCLINKYIKASSYIDTTNETPTVNSLILKGYSNSKIATDLDISVRTVSRYKAKLKDLLKLSTNSTQNVQSVNHLFKRQLTSTPAENSTNDENCQPTSQKHMNLDIFN